MNYLAHIFLSRNDLELSLGNFIADGLGRRAVEKLPHRIQQGVYLHRHIDRVTDKHASFRTASIRLREQHGKYSPVVLDIVNDHLLCRNWDAYEVRSFVEFEKQIYSGFQRLIQTLPPGRAREKTDTLIRHKYLVAYQTKEGMHGVLTRMDLRASFQSDFASALDHLYTDYDFFNTCFKQLFDDLLSEVDGWDVGDV